MDESSRRPWWRKKRWIAAGLLSVALAYPVSFVPAMWVATRIGKDPEHREEFALLAWLYRPMAVALIESPHAVRNAVYWTIELGTPEGVNFWRGYDRGVVWGGDGPGPGESYSYTLLYY